MFPSLEQEEERIYRMNKLGNDIEGKIDEDGGEEWAEIG